MSYYDQKLRVRDVAAEGADPTGSVDATSTVNGVLSSIGGNSTTLGSGRLIIPKGDYRISDTVDLNFKNLYVEAHGARFLWYGSNDRPVVRIRNSHHTRIRGLKVEAASPGAGSKATAAFSFYNQSGFNNSYNRLENITVGTESGGTTINFANGVLWEGDSNANDDMNVVDGYNVRWCDQGFNVSQSQNIDNQILSGRVVNCGTAYMLRADTTIFGAEVSGSTAADFDVLNCRVLGIQVTSEQSKRLLTISGSGTTFRIIGGYWMAAAANIDATGSFIFGVGNHSYQTVALENWQLTEEGGYAGPAPIITLTATNSGGAANKMLILRNVRGTSGATLNASTLAGCLSLGNADQRTIKGEGVWDGSVYNFFQNVFVGTAATIDFTRQDSSTTNTAANYVSGGDVTMTNANQFYDGPSISIAAGTWLLTGGVDLNPGSAGVATAKLWDGTTAVSSGEMHGASGGQFRTLSLSAIVTIASPQTYKISVAATTASWVIKATPANNGSGLGNTASYLNAYRIA